MSRSSPATSSRQGIISSSYRRGQLEQEIAYRASGAIRWRRWVVAHPTLVYLGGIALGTVPLLAAVGHTRRARC